MNALSASTASTHHKHFLHLTMLRKNLRCTGIENAMSIIVELTCALGSGKKPRDSIVHLLESLLVRSRRSTYKNRLTSGDLKKTQRRGAG